MSVIGSATLNIVPKVVGGLSNAINGEIRKANVAGLGKSAGSGFMGGFASGASIGVWSTVASAAIGAVTSSLDSAASRVDTLNNYPRIMQSLGVSADDANASMKVMSTSLDNVPTRLDDMATTVQGIYAATMKYGTSLSTVTDAGLALNSMLLAGGQSQVVVNSAMEQFRQMVSKGKPDLQDWKSLIQAAPGQMEQLAKSMLDTSATADDLYAALGGGKEGDYEGPYEWGSISMGEFVEKFSKLKGDFSEAAEEAQGGIGTAFTNMQNAVTRGVAGIMEAFGQERIASAIGDIKSAINSVFGRDSTEGIRGFASEVAPVLSTMWDELVDGTGKLGERLAPSVGRIASSVASMLETSLPAVGTVVGAVAEGFASAVELMTPLATTTLPAVATGISAVVMAAAPLAPAVATVAALAGAAGGLSTVAGVVSVGLETLAYTAGTGVLGESLLTAAAGAEGLAGTMAGPLGMAVVGVGAALGAYAIKQHEAHEFGRRFHATVRDISGVAEAADAAFASGARTVEEYGESHARAGADIDGLMESMSGYLGRVEDIRSSSEEQITLLGKYKSVIDECAGAGEVGADKMALLEWALSGLSEITGQTYDVQQVLKGSYEDEAGAVHNLREEIDQLIASKQQEARSDALKQMYQETYKEAAEAARELSRAEAEYKQSHDQWVADYIQAGGDAALAEQKWLEADNARERSLADNLGRAQVAYDALNGELGELNQMMENNAQASKAADDATLNWLNNNILAAEAVNDVFSDTGGIAAFSAALADAGVSTQQLDEIGEQNLMKLSNACQGNMDLMVTAVQAYNSQPVLDKDGNVHIEQAALMDAQGNVYTWNGTELVSKTTSASANDKQLTDAYGNVIKWNGTDAKVITANISNTSNPIPGLIGWLDALKARDGMTVSTSVTNTTHNVTVHETRNVATANTKTATTVATGGHAVPRHAAGYIAAGPTRTSFGLVGEDGIEAVYNNPDGSSDVYPLNNPRYLHYADPLGERIASSLKDSLEGTRPVVNVYLTYDASATASDMAYDLADKLGLVLDARGG